MRLKEAIIALQSDNPDRIHVEYFVDLCHKMAEAYLAQKVATGRLKPSCLSVSLEDFALDCIADLFARNDQNRLFQIADYYRPVLQSSNGEPTATGALLAATRKLIFTKVSDRIYLEFRAHDANLARTIRNLKAAIHVWQDQPAVSLAKHFGRQTVFIHNDRLKAPENEPPSPESLEAHLIRHIEDKTSDAQLLTRGLSVLQEVFGVSHYPLTWLAQAICQARIRANASLDKSGGVKHHFPNDRQSQKNGHPEVRDTDFDDEKIDRTVDYTRLIHYSVRTVQSRMHRSYVDTRKLDQQVYHAIFATIKDILTAQYVKGLQPFFLSALQSNIAGLTREEYATRYRTTFEYLFRLTRETFYDYAKKFLQP